MFDFFGLVNGMSFFLQQPNSNADSSFHTKWASPNVQIWTLQSNLSYTDMFQTGRLEHRGYGVSQCEAAVSARSVTTEKGIKSFDGSRLSSGQTMQSDLGLCINEILPISCMRIFEVDTVCSTKHQHFLSCHFFWTACDFNKGSFSQTSDFDAKLVSRENLMLRRFCDMLALLLFIGEDPFKLLFFLM